MSFLPKIEKLKLLKIWETDRLWQIFYKFKKYKQNPKNVGYKRENRTKTRIVMIENVGPIFLAFFLVLEVMLEILWETSRKL